MTSSEIEKVDAALRLGKSPDEIARELGISRQTLQYRIMRGGKRIVTQRHLEDARPQEETQQLAIA